MIRYRSIGRLAEPSGACASCAVILRSILSSCRLLECLRSATNASWPRRISPRPNEIRRKRGRVGNVMEGKAIASSSHQGTRNSLDRSRECTRVLGPDSGGAVHRLTRYRTCHATIESELFGSNEGLSHVHVLRLRSN